MKYENILSKIIESGKKSGYDVLSDGTRLIGRVPEIAPDARIHVLFPPATETELNKMTDQIPFAIPSSYEDFLSEFNGLILFSSGLSVYGIRRNYARLGAESWQPFSVISANTDDRPSNLPKQYMLVGSYEYAQIYLCIDLKSGELIGIDRSTMDVVRRWDNLTDMLKWQVDRLSKKKGSDHPLLFIKKSIQ